MTGSNEQRRDANDRATHNRLILALDDLEEARDYALYLANKRPSERILVEALNAALIVAYGRCFSGQGGVSAEALAAVPDRFIQPLHQTLRDLHGRLLTLRHEEFAHSDADAAGITVTRFVMPDEVFVGPDARRNLRSLLEPAEIDRAIELINSLRLAMLSEIGRIQHRFQDRGDIPTQRAF